MGNTDGARAARLDVWLTPDDWSGIRAAALLMGWGRQAPDTTARVGNVSAMLRAAVTALADGEPLTTPNRQRLDVARLQAVIRANGMDATLNAEDGYLAERHPIRLSVDERGAVAALASDAGITRGARATPDSSAYVRALLRLVAGL